MSKTPPNETARRATLPEVLLSEDVATVLKITPSSARRLIREGRLGPFVRLGRRLAIRKETFLDHLACGERSPEERS